VTAGQWLLVEYEEEFFLGVVLPVASETASARVRCLEKPYRVSEPQELEKELISAWYDLLSSVHCSCKATHDPSQEMLEVHLLKQT
jgi:hypothetical protein